MRTIPARKEEMQSKWFVVDARDKVLGRLATKVASIIRGKHNPYYTPHLAAGDFVVVVNADKIIMTGNKAQQKVYTRYTGYHSGLRTTTFKTMMEKKPDYIIRHAVEGMLPKNRLGRKLDKRLFVYAGSTHPHQAQKPEPLEI
jgi:large subunit ribosomal protein L13